MESIQILFYQTEQDSAAIEVHFEDETFWLSQKKMTELFGVEVNTVNYHLKKIYKSRELEEAATIRKFRIVQKEGSRDVNRNVDFYNLDAIISVGYRVNSSQTTQFRIWATIQFRNPLNKKKKPGFFTGIINRERKYRDCISCKGKTIPINTNNF